MTITDDILMTKNKINIIKELTQNALLGDTNFLIKDLISLIYELEKNTNIEIDLLQMDINKLKEAIKI